MSRDLAILLLNRVLRAFGFGGSAVLVSFQLEAKGLSAVGIGLVLSVALGAASLTGLASALASVRFGRRRSLAVTGLLMAFAGGAVAIATQGWVLALAAATGMLGAGAMDVGPFLAVEQAVLSETTAARSRNRAFARYSLTGALAASAGGAVAGFAGDPARSEAFYLLYGVIGVATACLPLIISASVEGEAEAPAFGSVRPLLALAGLFAVDSLGGGLVVQSVLVLWLHVRFGAGPEVLGPAFAAMQLLSGLSYELSGRIADRIGLIQTMVFTHLPSNALLLLVAFSPNLPVALALLLLRATTAQMDAPARQAYVVSIVKPSERAGAVAMTGALRGVALALGPVITGLAIQTAAVGLPFLIAGGLKLSYDAAIYAGFRRRRAEHEVVV